MEILKGYRLEKNILDNEWLVFRKKGLNGWFQVHKSKKKSEAKNWILKKVKNKK